jgi:uncharacterized protein
MFALSERAPEIGTIRETFFINMLESAKHKVNFTKAGDFMINKKMLFEVVGKGKTGAQLKGGKNSFIAKDDIEKGYDKSIPLYMFGMMF